MSDNEYSEAFWIACELLSGDCIYGIDNDSLFSYILEKENVVTANTYYDFIVNNIDRFSDVDSIREEAVKRLGF